MAKPLVSDELWTIIEPLIPKVERRYRFPGRRRIDDRKVLSGILFVLQTGIPWEYLPKEMGCGSGMTCWRRLKEWQEAGVWQRLRPRQKRLQAPYADLRTGHAARALAERRQPQRHPRAAAARRCDPAGARQTRPAAPATAAAIG